MILAERREARGLGYRLHSVGFRYQTKNSLAANRDGVLALFPALPAGSSLPAHLTSGHMLCDLTPQRAQHARPVTSSDNSSASLSAFSLPGSIMPSSQDFIRARSLFSGSLAMQASWEPVRCEKERAFCFLCSSRLPKRIRCAPRADAHQ